MKITESRLRSLIRDMLFEQSREARKAIRTDRRLNRKWLKQLDQIAKAQGAAGMTDDLGDESLDDVELYASSVQSTLGQVDAAIKSRDMEVASALLAGLRKLLDQPEVSAALEDEGVLASYNVKHSELSDMLPSQAQASVEAPADEEVASEKDQAELGEVVFDYNRGYTYVFDMEAYRKSQSKDALYARSVESGNLFKVPAGHSLEKDILKTYSHLELGGIEGAAKSDKVASSRQQMTKNVSDLNDIVEFSKTQTVPRAMADRALDIWNSLSDTEREQLEDLQLEDALLEIIDEKYVN